MDPEDYYRWKAAQQKRKLRAEDLDKIMLGEEDNYQDDDRQSNKSNQGIDYTTM